MMYNFFHKISNEFILSKYAKIIVIMKKMMMKVLVKKILKIFFYFLEMDEPFNLYENYSLPTSDNDFISNKENLSEEDDFQILKSSIILIKK